MIETCSRDRERSHGLSNDLKRHGGKSGQWMLIYVPNVRHYPSNLGIHQTTNVPLTPFKPVRTIFASVDSTRKESLSSHYRVLVLRGFPFIVPLNSQVSVLNSCTRRLSACHLPRKKRGFHGKSYGSPEPAANLWDDPLLS